MCVVCGQVRAGEREVESAQLERGQRPEKCGVKRAAARTLTTAYRQLPFRKATSKPTL